MKKQDSVHNAPNPRKGKWTNVVEYNKQDYLAECEFKAVKQKVRRCWRVLGMLQLRMENDISKNARKKLPTPEILKRLDEVTALIDSIREQCEKE